MNSFAFLIVAAASSAVAFWLAGRAGLPGWVSVGVALFVYGVVQVVGL